MLHSLQRIGPLLMWQAILACAAAVVSPSGAEAKSSPGSRAEIVRLLEAAESDYYQAHRRYAPFQELLGSGQLKMTAEKSGRFAAFNGIDTQPGHQLVAGYSLDLLVAGDGGAFKLSLTPASDTCMPAWFTDNSGVIFEGKAAECDVTAISDSLPVESSAHNLGSPTPVPIRTRNWSPPADVDQILPPVLRRTPCPLDEVLKSTSKHAEELVENMQRFSAKDRIELVEFGRNGKPRDFQSGVFDYVAQIDRNPSGTFWVEEYRTGSLESPAALSDTGTAAFALIFHPLNIANFEFHCEGLADLNGIRAWQVHLQESRDPNRSFHALRIGKDVYQLFFKGRAWIAADNQEVLRLETDLVAPNPAIQLHLEHLEIVYAPVAFKRRNLQLWLPQSASLFVEYHGHRYERLHNFSKFELFWIDTAQFDKQPEAVRKSN